LTNREFLLLEYFIRHCGELSTRDRLLENIWGNKVYPTTRTLDTHVRRLRKHIEPDPGEPRYIKTVHSVGYLFEIQ
jgi:DNA-binding response OmpR family regulator